MERADATFPRSHPLQVKEEGRGPLGSGRNFLGKGKLEGLQAVKEVAERITHSSPVVWGPTLMVLRLVRSPGKWVADSRLHNDDGCWAGWRVAQILPPHPYPKPEPKIQDSSPSWSGVLWGARSGGDSPENGGILTSLVLSRELFSCASSCKQFILGRSRQSSK